MQSVPGFPQDRMSLFGSATEGEVEENLTVEVPKSTPRVKTKEETKSGQGSSMPLIALLGLLIIFGGLLGLSPYLMPQEVQYVYGSLHITPSHNSVAISLRTTPPLRCEFLYGPTGKTSSVAVISHTYQSEHQGELTGLQSGTSYEYRLRFIGEEGRLVETAQRKFRTLPHHD